MPSVEGTLRFLILFSGGLRGIFPFYVVVFEGWEMEGGGGGGMVRAEKKEKDSIPGDVLSVGGKSWGRGGNRGSGGGGNPQGESS